MKRAFITLSLLLTPALVGLFNQQAFGVVLTTETVDWNADGTGTLLGAGVTYTTQAIGNAGLTFGNNWSAIPATTGPNVGYGGNFLEAVALGTLGSNTQSAQTVNFTSVVTNPILFFNYLDANTTFDFLTNTVSLFNGVPAATLSSNVVTVGAGVVDGFSDAFAVQLSGSFTTLTFNTNTTGGGGTVGFTVGEEVPEPASMMGLLLGLSPFGMGWYHKRKQLQKSA